MRVRVGGAALIEFLVGFGIFLAALLKTIRVTMDLFVGGRA